MSGRTPPDLSDPVQYRAYKKELRGVARKTRWSGLFVTVVGAGCALASRSAPDPRNLRVAAIILITFGIGILILGMARRTIYHAIRTAPRDAETDETP